VGIRNESSGRKVFWNSESKIHVGERILHLGKSFSQKRGHSDKITEKSERGNKVEKVAKKVVWGPRKRDQQSENGRKHFKTRGEKAKSWKIQ